MICKQLQAARTGARETGKEHNDYSRVHGHCLYAVEKLRLRKSRQRSATILPKPLFDCVVFGCAATARAVARYDPLAFVVCETVTKIECGSEAGALDVGPHASCCAARARGR